MQGPEYVQIAGAAALGIAKPMIDKNMTSAALVLFGIPLLDMALSGGTDNIAKGAIHGAALMAIGDMAVGLTQMGAL